MTQSATAEQEQDPKFGVLFVHGIGDQQQYSTLARFGGALQRWLSRWLEGTPRQAPPEDHACIAPAPLVDVVSVEHHPARSEDPAHATMVLQGSSPQTWVLAEAWWASEVTPPRFRDFVRWILPMFPWLAAEYPIAATRRADPEDPSPSLHGRHSTRLGKFTLSGLLWLASPVIAVVLMVVCLLLALLQQLPVVGKWVTARTVGLVNGLGDAYLFAHDALARAAMIQRIQHTLWWLRDQQHCEKVAVVAHSQGAALCHDMLRSDHRPDRKVELLVTVGSGVQRLDGFRHLYQDARLRSLGWVGIAGLTILVGSIFLVLGGLGMPGVPGSWATLGIGLILAGALLPGTVLPTNSRGQLWGAAIAGLGALALLVAGVNASGSAGARLSAGGLLMAAGIAVYGLAYHAVKRQVMAHQPLALPAEAVEQWVDYYSTADPVPNGPLRTWPGSKRPTEDQTQVHPLPRVVYNLRSVQADHSFYFDNLDEFVSRLAVDLTAKPTLDPAKPTLDLGQLSELSLTGTRAKRRWRTACRSNVRNLLLLAGLLGAGAVSLRLGGGRGWAGLGADLGVQSARPYGSPLGRASHAALDWLSKRPFLGALKGVDLQLFSGVLVATAVVVVATFALEWLWSTWDQGAIDRFFEQHLSKPAQTGILAAWRRLPAVSFLTLAALLLAGTAAVAQRYAGAWWLWLAFLTFGVFTAVVTVERWWVCLGPPMTETLIPNDLASSPKMTS